MLLRRKLALCLAPKQLLVYSLYLFRMDFLKAGGESLPVAAISGFGSQWRRLTDRSSGADCSHSSESQTWTPGSSSTEGNRIQTSGKPPSTYSTDIGDTFGSAPALSGPVLFFFLSPNKNVPRYSGHLCDLVVVEFSSSRV